MSKKYIFLSFSFSSLCYIFLATLTFGVVFAYCLNGQDWTYQSSPMGENYIVQENTSDSTGEASAVKNASNTWNNAGAKFSFTYGGITSSCNAPSYDNTNCIRWGTLDAGTLARTTWWYDINSGNILEVDCVFNDNYTWSTASTTPSGQYDVESVMLHEFGHYLALCHSTAPAIMQPTIPDGIQRRALTSDDIKGIKAIYGEKRHSCSTLGYSNAVVAPAPGQAAINIILMFSTLIVVPIIRIFRRKKK